MKARKSLTSTDYRGHSGRRRHNAASRAQQSVPYAAKFVPASDENADAMRQLLEDAGTVKREDQGEQHLKRGGAVDGPVHGELSRVTHIKMSKTLQHLESEIRVWDKKVRRFEDAVQRTGKPVARLALAKATAERQRLIDAIWDTHDWAKSIRHGRART